MDCILIIPAALTKFNHTALAALLAVQLHAAGEVGISCDWVPGVPITAPPAICTYQANACLDPAAVWAAYAPNESDAEENSRKVIEAKKADPVIKELIDKIAVLEAKVATPTPTPLPTPKPSATGTPVPK